MLQNDCGLKVKGHILYFFYSVGVGSHPCGGYHVVTMWLHS